MLRSTFRSVLFSTQKQTTLRKWHSVFEPPILWWFFSFVNAEANLCYLRGGVKLEFVQNSFDSIRKGKKYSKNSKKINSKFVRFDSNYRVESNFSDAGFVRKFMIRLIRKGKRYSKNSMKINSKFVRFDSTPTIQGQS